MSSLPPTWQQRLREEQPDPSKWNKELTVLMDTSIEARPLTLPTSSKIRLKDTNYVIYRVRRKNGEGGDKTRYMELRAAGYSNVTLDDIENPEDLTAHVSADKTEITEGIDLVWMKAKKEIHYGAMKFHMERALQMTTPRRGTAAESIMRSVPLAVGERDALAASRTTVISEGQVNEYEARANDNNSVRKGTPQWEAIVNEGKEKKGK